MGVIWYKMDKWPHSNIKNLCLLVDVKEDNLVGKGLIHPTDLQGGGAGSRSVRTRSTNQEDA